ncbi:MAG: AAA family ATPase [Candidatus Absconditabacterales bacterium]|nr:AAA family ATPase [Candidatus Absconditabacterales bacterium]
MSEKNWITEAKEHFKNDGGKVYISGDEISKKSKVINERLQSLLKEKLKDDKDVELNLQGSKWSVQGQNKLTGGIWYRAYYKEFGKDYPVVFGVHLGEDGLNFAIQIYNNVLDNPSLSEKLGEIITETVKDKKLDSKDRDNENEKYKDFGYFGLEKFDDTKFNDVLSKYKSVVYEINQKIFEKTIEEFNNFLNKPSDITHLSFGIDDNSFYQNKKHIKQKVGDFLEKPTFKNLEWWDKSINSANMQGNRTNLIKKLEGLTLEEVKSLKDDNKLEKVKETFEQIKKLVYGDSDNVKSDLNFERVETDIKNIEGMNATARELAYYIQMDEDKIPLVNGITTYVISHIEKVTKILLDEKLISLQSKIDEIKNKITLSQEKFEFKSYYVIDQFFNLLHKISKKDLSNTTHPELYQYAYLFANLTGKADKKAVEKDEFIETLRKGKNIIYYGAPGTGKTFGVKNNILNIVEDEEKQFVMTQFHPSYTYEDFIEGVKPAGLKDGVMNFELKDGEFKIFCEKAKIDEEKFSKENNFYEAIKKYGYFFFVDEINRAELSRVFGELLYSLEYRGKNGKIKTQYSSLRDEREYFYIPENIFFIGTMNDVDRSIDSFDLALRRRFVWLRKDCDYQVIENEIDDEKSISYREACEKLNNYVINIDGLGEKYQIGHSYFLKIHNYINRNITQNSMNELFDFHIEPLLTEYLRVEYDEKGIKQHLNEARKTFKFESK